LKAQQNRQTAKNFDRRRHPNAQVGGRQPFGCRVSHHGRVRAELAQAAGDENRADHQPAS